MFEEYKLSKIEILIQQKKYTEAEKALKNELAVNPYNIDALSLLAEVYLQQDQLTYAKNLIESAIGQSPDDPTLFYIKARILLQQEQFDEAENIILHSIELDPHDADYFALYANVKLIRKSYAEALEYADKALELDPEDLLALNTRSTALLKLNKKDDAFETIEGALREDPNNAYTHANYGWNLLEKGDYKKALEHFKESLKTDPNYAYAQDGIMEALKAKNPIYRMFLRYAFWIGNLSSKYQWGFIIGVYLIFRFLRSIAKNNEALQPFLTPILIAVAVIAFSTWVINPIANLFLRFNPYGQLLLDKKEKISSNLVALSLATFVIGLIAYLSLNDERFLSITVFGFAMMPAFGSMFATPRNGKPTLLIYTIAMGICGLIAISLTFNTNDLFNTFSTIFFFGFIAYQWIANYILIRANNV